MDDFIAITRCLKSHGDSGEFSFRGAYRGEFIRGLCLSAPPGVRFEVGEDYLMYVRAGRLEHGRLWGSALKVRKLSEVFGRD